MFETAHRWNPGRGNDKLVMVMVELTFHQVIQMVFQMALVYREMVVQMEKQREKERILNFY
jgi:hypothetical protein